MPLSIKCKTIKRLIPATCAWVLLLSTTALFFIFPCRRLHEEYHYYITIAQAIIAFFVISNLFATTFVDPGIIKRASPDEDKDDFSAPIQIEVKINKHTVRMKWCSTCQFYRPPRCSHCSVCDNCVEKFDHHCPWVNNCIGKRNYRHFFFFLIFLTIHMITVFIWCLIFVINNRNRVNETAVVVTIVLIVIIIIFFIPIVGLTTFHVVLVARGRTTNEQVTKKFNQHANPFSEGIWYNCLYTICGPRYPGLYKPKKRKNIRKHSDIRVYMDDITFKIAENEKKIEDLNFGVVDNSKDVPMERLDDGAKNSSSESSVVASNYDSQNFHQTNFHDHLDDPIRNYQPGSDNNLFDLTKQSEDNHIVTMHHTENGKKETTFIALPSTQNFQAPQQSSSLKSSIFPSHQFNKISASKSNSTNEISSHLKSFRSPQKMVQQGTGPEGGMLIYYSPDAGGYVSNPSNNHFHHQTINQKFNSETELQKFNSSSFKRNSIGKNYSQQQQPFLYIDDDSLDSSSSPPLNHHYYHSNGGKNSKTSPRNDSRGATSTFSKALEITNKLEQKQLQHQATTNSLASNSTNRQSQYEMNYEISV